MKTDRLEVFLVASPGLEGLVASESRTFGLAETRVEPGGVTGITDSRGIALLNVGLRMATRVLVRVGSFDAPGRRELGTRAAKVAWGRYFAPGAGLRIHATAQKSRLFHTGLIAEVLHEATGTVPSKDAGAPELHVRLVRDRCVLSMDTSGELLHRRGWRQETSRAPLRETLAAGLLAAAGYDGTGPFVDPMCGSGTIAIEAALVATRTAPGLGRAFAFERFPGFDGAVLAQVREEARAQIRPALQPIIGSDLHSGALAAARRNAERAGATVVFERADVATRAAPGVTGHLVTNPPYGLRVGDEREAVQSLKRALGGPFRGWTRAVLCGSPALRALVGIEGRELRLDNGGLAVTCVVAAPEAA